MALIFEPFLTDHTLQLANEEYVRTFSIGSNWQKIRIGMRICFPTYGSSTNTEFYFGICQGTTNAYRSSSTTDWMGFTLGTPYGNALWNYNVARYLAVGGGNVGVIKRSGNLSTLGTSQSGTIDLSTNPLVHNVIFLDILKASPSYTLIPWVPNLAQSAVNNTRTAWAYSMSNESAPANVTSYSTSTAYAGSGLFDSLSLVWSKLVPVMFVYDIGVCRFT